MIVLDANVALAWVLKDSQAGIDYSEAVALAAVKGEALIAPAVFPGECSYVILQAGRRSKWKAVKVAEHAEMVGVFAPALYIAAGTIADNVRFAIKHNITGFDAYYLALAMRMRAKLATLDSGLRAAAKLAGVDLFTG